VTSSRSLSVIGGEIIRAGVWGVNEKRFAFLHAVFDGFQHATPFGLLLSARRPSGGFCQQGLA
jgi:hypothetical protein